MGGYFVYKHEVKSRLEQIELEKDYAKFCEEYKKLSLDGLVSKDFDYVRVKTEWQDEENFSTYKEGLHVWYQKNYKSYLKELYKDNNIKSEELVSFAVWFTMDGEPYGVTHSTHKWEADPWGRRQLWIDDMVTFLKDEHGYYVDKDGYIRDESKPVVIKDEKLLKQVGDLFEAAFKDYQKINSLVEKQ